MSLQEIFRPNLKSLQIGSKLNMFPVQFTKHGTAKICEMGYKRIAFYCLFLNAILYTLYMEERFLLVVTAEKFSIVQFAPHALALTVAGISLFWNAFFFIWMEPITNIVFNEVLTIISSVRPSKARVQERLTTLLPFVCIECTFIPIIPYVFGPDSPQTVYSGLTSYFQKSPFLMVATILYECLTFAFIMFSFNYGIFVQFAIIQCSQRELETGLKELRNTSALMPEHLLNYAKKCRRIQLRIAYFNKVYSSSIYIIKIECLFDAMFGFFIAIKIWETHPFLAACGAMLGIMDVSCYCAMYSRGFEIPLLMEDYKGKLVLQTARLNGTPECMEVRKIVKSVPKVAIVVGEFQELQRSTTIDAVDFLVNNVVNLLVSYPGPIAF